jgi:hypothetical protein
MTTNAELEFGQAAAGSCLLGIGLLALHAAIERMLTRVIQRLADRGPGPGSIPGSLPLTESRRWS